jgi:hypothetical protein
LINVVKSGGEVVVFYRRWSFVYRQEALGSIVPFMKTAHSR